MDLFDALNNNEKTAPLADRMRPRNLSEFFGQKHLIFPGALLVRAIAADRVGSCIFFGPPGVGKTTLASIIASGTKGDFVKLNAVSNGVADAKKVIEEARERRRIFGKRTYLLLDECHRWNKAQSDSVLSAIEDGSIIFIGSTTENPYISMTRAIVSRCSVFELKTLSEDDIVEGLRRAIADKERGLGNLNIEITDDALRYFAWGAAGDLRNAMNGLELAALTTPLKDGVIYIDKLVAAQSIQRKAISTDTSTYYDMLSAFCKSLRGSDSDGALYWAFRLIAAGCDPLLILRRLIVHASEDVGLADSTALVVATSALTAFQNLGFPEGNIPLAHAIIYVCTRPKSNSVVRAKDAAEAAVERTGASYIPLHLRNNNNSSLEKSNKPYLYPHNFGGYVLQQYLPDELKDEKFYEPCENGEEKDIKKFLQEIAILAKKYEQ